jgi:pimeloyl-ACP methyl ester carboxylesterase
MPLAGDGAMKVIGVGGVPTATRVSLRHHVVDLAEGHRAGVHVAGAGVPLVFLHGIGLDSRVYSGLLESLPQLGFLTVAIDAPAHGDTPALSGRPSFGERAEFLNLVLDELGIRRAVLVGHSMGGRNVLEIAASRPDRVIAAVLLNAAAGHTFDSDERPAAIRLSTLVAALLRAGWDARSGLGDLRALDRKTYLALRNKFSCQALRSAAQLRQTARAIADATESSALAEKMRAHGMTTVVVHSTHDLVVPLKSGLECAQATAAALYLLPDAYHFWLLSDPGLAADVMNQLVRAEVGRAIADVARDQDLSADSSAADWHRKCLAPDARLLDLLAKPSPIGPVSAFYGPAVHRAARAELQAGA